MGPRAFLARVGTPLTACSVHVLSSIEFTACCEPSASWPPIKSALPSWARTIICRAQGTPPKHGWTLLYRQTAPFYHELVGPFGSETTYVKTIIYSVLDSLENFRGKNGKLHLMIIWPLDTGTRGESRSEYNAGTSNEAGSSSPAPRRPRRAGYV